MQETKMEEMGANFLLCWRKKKDRRLFPALGTCEEKKRRLLNHTFSKYLYPAPVFSNNTVSSL